MLAPAPLTDAQLAHYFREGYVLAPGLVPRPAINALVQAAQRIAAPDGSVWTASTFDHQQPTKDADLHRLLVEPAVIAAAEQIFEAPARVYYGMVAVVPARGGKGLPWHQDNQYSHLIPSALNIFIACCRVTADKANLWVAPRSHLQGVQPSREAGGEWGGHRTAVVEPTNGLLMPDLAPGDAVIFDRCTYHRSGPNATPAPRYAYAAQYQADYTRAALTGEKDPLRMRARDLQQKLAELLA